MHPVIKAAIEEAGDAFGREQVTFAELADSSVKVTVSGLDIGDGWDPRIISITTILLTTFPSPPPYPFNLPAALRKADGGTLPNMRPATVDGVVVSQLSVRPLGSQPTSSFPALIRAVVSWLRDR